MTTHEVIEKPEYSLDLTGSHDLVKEFVASVFRLSSPVKLSQLKGGITNVLLKGEIGNVAFLIRAYGKGTNTIINRDREYATHMHLQSLGLAPVLYARFGNGLIYGFLPGTSIHYTQMSSAPVMQGVANRLGQWHSLLSGDTIEAHLKRLSGKNAYSRDVWQLLSSWIDSMPANVVESSKDELRSEMHWIKNKLSGAGPTVVSHCDLLSGNIIVPLKELAEPATTTINTSTPAYTLTSEYKPSELVSFIDYEYTMPAPRGFDIANHFMEWQGFDCKTELIPTPSPANATLRFWAYHYLSSVRYHSHTKLPEVTEEAIDELIGEVRAWWGMPGFYWGIWAAIQASISEIDFDYANYAKERLSEYWRWKTDVYPGLKLKL